MSRARIVPPPAPRSRRALTATAALLLALASLIPAAATTTANASTPSALHVGSWPATTSEDFLSTVGPDGASMGDGVRQYEGRATTYNGTTTQSTWMPPGVQGLDVSSHQSNVNWGAEVGKGARFAYVKASEGTYYLNPAFSSQFNDSYAAGLIRGSYHFAIPHPDAGTAAAQARYFVANGGVWSSDGMTLPPLLDIEYNPYVGKYFGNTCYDRTPEQIVAWTREFSDTVYSLTKRLPAIYTTTDWWRTCAGNNGGFSGNPLHIAAYGVSQPGTLPNGWLGYDIWQYSSTGPFAGDSNVWRGTQAQLKSFATGVTVNTNGAIGQSWVAAGGAGGSWGKATSLETCNSSMCLQVFEHRMAYWTAQRGVLSVATSGDLGALWRSAGAAASRFGLPTSNETCTDRYCFQNFERGVLYSSAATGAKSIFLGADGNTIGGYWNKLGGANSKYGLPRTDESCKATFCVQQFERGSIYWTSATGIQPVFTDVDNSTVGGAWAAMGGVDSKYGFPVSAELCTTTFCEQRFQRGRILWSPAGGIQPVFTNGDNSTIGGLWVTSGAAGSRYGFPIGPETCSASSCQQRFQFGTIVWSPVGGIQPLYYSNDNSTIAAYYTLKLGGTSGKFGFPISAEACQSNSCQQRFQFGTVVWSGAGGIQPLYYSNDNSTIAAHYTLKLGGTSGKFGFPVNSETCTGGACVQKFQYGNVYWSAAGGIQPVWTNGSAATVGGYYESLGGPGGPLSYPATAELCQGTVCFQRFLNGYITWSAATGLNYVDTTRDIGKAWLGQGGLEGTLGVPRDREQCSGTTSCIQNFANGTIRWTSAGGTSITRNT